MPRKGGQGCPYAISEQKKIVDYIVRKRAYYEVKGNVLWKRMESSGILEGRSWQSLKEHFKKKVFPHLDMKRFGLTSDELQLFERGYTKSPRKKQHVPKVPKLFPDATFPPSSEDLVPEPLPDATFPASYEDLVPELLPDATFPPSYVDLVSEPLPDATFLPSSEDLVSEPLPDATFRPSYEDLVPELLPDATFPPSYVDLVYEPLPDATFPPSYVDLISEPLPDATFPPSYVDLISEPFPDDTFPPSSDEEDCVVVVNPEPEVIEIDSESSDDIVSEEDLRQSGWQICGTVG